MGAFCAFETKLTDISSALRPPLEGKPWANDGRCLVSSVFHLHSDASRRRLSTGGIHHQKTSEVRSFLPNKLVVLRTDSLENRYMHDRKSLFPHRTRDSTLLAECNTGNQFSLNAYLHPAASDIRLMTAESSFIDHENNIDASPLSSHAWQNISEATFKDDTHENNDHLDQGTVYTDITSALRAGDFQNTQADPSRGGSILHQPVDDMLNQQGDVNRGDRLVSSKVHKIREAGSSHRSLRQQATSTSRGIQRSDDYVDYVMTHPGAISRTTTHMKKDPARCTAAVSMETVVSCAGEAYSSTSLDMDDYMTLALQVLVDSAQRMKKAQCDLAHDADPLIQERRKLIVDTLDSGEIVECKPIDPPSIFGHESYVMKLRNLRTGHEIMAMFKPRVEGDGDGWHRAAVEWVAYELNLLLGMDYVPPVSYRKAEVTACGKTYEEGAFIYWVPHASELRKIPANQWSVPVARLLSDTRILDMLLNNSDRHRGNFLFGEHWADGNLHAVLIDHAAGFRKEAEVRMEHDNAFQTGPVHCISAKTYMRLRFLDKNYCMEKFHHVLSEAEVEQLMSRRDEILEYFDELVGRQGYHRTVIE